MHWPMVTKTIVILKDDSPRIFVVQPHGEMKTYNPLITYNIYMRSIKRKPCEKGE